MFVTKVATAHILEGEPPERLNKMLKRWFPRDSQTAAAKVHAENKAAIAALQHCATQNQARSQVFQHTMNWPPCCAPRSQRSRCDSGQQILDIPSKGRKV
jgi:hypothetical protein